MACDGPALDQGFLRPLERLLADGLGQELVDGQLADLVEVWNHHRLLTTAVASMWILPGRARPARTMSLRL